jgi:hypothetical protein
MSTELKAHFSNAETWKRGLFILLFAVFYGIAEVVLGAVVLFQFGSLLITGRTNDKLKTFSRGLTAYFYQLLQFFTYRSDLKPFPFSDWPEEGLEEEPQQPARKPRSKRAVAAAKEEEEAGEGGTPEAKTTKRPPAEKE